MSNKPTNSNQDKTLDPSLGGKRQARRRLVGAAIVCAAATAGLFAVLDRDPKPLGPDVVLKGSNQTAPLSAPLGDSSRPVVPVVPVPTAPSSEPPVKEPLARDPPPKEEPQTLPLRPPLVVNPLPVEAPKAIATPKPDPIEKLALGKKSVDKPAEKQTEKPTPNKTGYALQVGAFANKESANNAMAKLKAAGVSGFTETISTGAGDRTRVRAGPYKDREAAQAAMAKLKAAGIEAALIAP